MLPRVPEATYLVAASRLRPGLDGGHAIAVMRRAQDLAAAGADVQILTFDTPPIDGVVDDFARFGLAGAQTRYRNLFAELRERPGLVRDAALAPERAQPDPRVVPGKGTLVHDAAGYPLVTLPFVEAPDWHRVPADILVHDVDGRVLGAIPGFNALYRLWVEAVAGQARAAGAKEVVVIAEARALGEALGPRPRRYALVHTVHNAHTLPPHAWDSPLDDFWAGWFDAAPDFDAVLWPTRRQREEAARRFGGDERWFVVPHPARPEEAPAREPAAGLALLIAGLRPQKRIDHALRAWAEVVRRLPDARLEILGEGPLRPQLEAVIAELGIGDSVRLRGHVPRADQELARAALLLLTSNHEGQSLVVLEALAAGVPVVSYDMPYGPGEMIGDSGGGIAVPSGDIESLADAIVDVLGEADRGERLGAAGRAWAVANGLSRTLSAFAEAVEAALAHNSATEHRESIR